MYAIVHYSLFFYNEKDLKNPSERIETRIIKFRALGDLDVLLNFGPKGEGRRVRTVSRGLCMPTFN